MSRKVTFTETVTAEVLPAMPPLRSASRGEPEPGAVSGAVTEAVADVGVQVIGVAPGMALGEQYTATATAISHAAHNATANQVNASTLHGASTVVAIAKILGNAPVAVRRRRPRPAQP